MTKKFRTIEDLAVGDIVHIFDINNRSDKKLSSAIVSKIGTKLIYIEQYRRDFAFRKDTLRANDEYGHQELIIDVDQYYENKETVRIIDKIRQGIHYNTRVISLESAKAAAILLGIDIT